MEMCFKRKDFWNTEETQRFLAILYAAIVSNSFNSSNSFKF